MTDFFLGGSLNARFGKPAVGEAVVESLVLPLVTPKLKATGLSATIGDAAAVVDANGVAAGEEANDADVGVDCPRVTPLEDCPRIAPCPRGRKPGRP